MIKLDVVAAPPTASAPPAPQGSVQNAATGQVIHFEVDPPPARETLPRQKVFQKLKYRVMRWFNQRLNEREYRRRKVYLRSFPEMLCIDPTNVCQLKCPLCATGTGSAREKKGMLQQPMLERVLEQLGPYLYQVHFYNWGEPLLNPKLPDLIRYVKTNYPAKTYFSTNLNYLPEKLADRILLSGVDEITCAVDGLTEASYQKYRVGGSLAAVLENLRLLLRRRTELGLGKSPKIIFRFMIMKHNEHELEDARRMAKEMGASFRSKSVRIDMSDFNRGSYEQKLAQRSEWLPANKEHNRYEKHQDRLDWGRQCQDLWKRTFVTPNGAVHPCCNTFDPGDHFATHFPEDFYREIWNGPRYTLARAIFHGLDIPHDPYTACKSCVAQGNHLFVS